MQKIHRNKLVIILAIFIAFQILAFSSNAFEVSDNNISDIQKIENSTLAPVFNEQSSKNIQRESGTQEFSNTISTLSKNELRVHFIDVGQADSIFIELPDGKDMLIDAGNNEDGEKVCRYVEKYGYEKIDYLVGTHPHEDHIGGLDDVVNQFDIGSIYLPKKEHTTKAFEDVLTAINKKGLKVSTATAGKNILSDNDINISIIAPNRIAYDDLNNYSAVIKLTYKNSSFLFMGDAETQSENEITANVDVDVLKVGHHGSKYSTSESFLKDVSPKFAVISVGSDNCYGHPAAETIKRLENENALIYRTDKNGTIILTTDGNKYDVSLLSADNRNNATNANNTSIDSIDENNNHEAVSSSIDTKDDRNANNSETKAISSIEKGTENKQITVYITKTGSKYHCANCRCLSNSKIAISLSDAKMNGYDACLICNPPK